MYTLIVMGVQFSKQENKKPVIDNKTRIDYEKYRNLLIENQNLKADIEALKIQVDSLKEIIKNEGNLIKEITEELDEE